MKLNYLELDLEKKEYVVRIGDIFFTSTTYDTLNDFLSSFSEIEEVKIFGYKYDKLEFARVLDLILNKAVNLDLSSNGIKGEVIISICKKLVTSKSLKEVNLSSNSILDKGIDVLSVFRGSKIEKVDVSNNWIEDINPELISKLNPMNVKFEDETRELVGEQKIIHSKED